MSKTILKGLLAGAAMLVGTVAAWADDYPTKPVTWIVPYTPGGITDTQVR